MKRSLFTRNFTLLLLGQAASLFGNFLLRLALSMYVLETSGSASVFAGIVSLSTVPTILLSPLGGVLADRADRRNLMVLLDVCTGLSVLGAAFLLAAGGGLAVAAGLLIVLSVLGAFETPVVQACIPSMLSGDDITRGNAAVNQAASLSYLIAPALGGAAYAAFGLLPVLYASAGCFLLTAFLECFIRLPREPAAGLTVSAVRRDLAESIRFLRWERPCVWKMLLLAALSRFFVMGIAVVGLPFLVRAALGLDARYYGAAESVQAVAAIVGSVLAGLLSAKLPARRLSALLAALGAFLLPAGLLFGLPVSAAARYGVTVACFGGMQAAASVFSIFAVSLIQRGTPERLLGKVMAYTSAVTLCAQPAGQMVYGLLFDRYAASWILLLTGTVVCALGAGSAGLFAQLENDRKNFPA